MSTYAYQVVTGKLDVIVRQVENGYLVETRYAGQQSQDGRYYYITHVAKSISDLQKLIGELAEKAKETK